MLLCLHSVLIFVTSFVYSQNRINFPIFQLLSSLLNTFLDNRDHFSKETFSALCTATKLQLDSPRNWIRLFIIFFLNQQKWYWGFSGILYKGSHLAYNRHTNAGPELHMISLIQFIFSHTHTHTHIGRILFINKVKNFEEYKSNIFEFWWVKFLYVLCQGMMKHHFMVVLPGNCPTLYSTQMRYSIIILQ